MSNEISEDCSTGLHEYCTPCECECHVSNIHCPLCGELVKQVASATLDLALSQHVRWVCMSPELRRIANDW